MAAAPRGFIEQVDWLPLGLPSKLLFCGVNYASHLEENPSGVLPEEPFFFAKLPSAIIGPGDPIRIPYEGCQVDYEVELAVVIGRRAQRLAPEDALDAVFGYTLVNDVSARDVQMRNAQVTLGKNFDTFCPIGPRVVTVDKIPDPSMLRISTRVNGELRQDAATADMLFRVPELLSRVSHVMTLEPGDIVTTGTPAGVGCFRNPPLYLQPGDVVVVEADEIGQLENPVVAGW
jgi:2-keto-4-pentenoate hydratase/2-oxohepta-3-ene-1,7-dioic acid hydratase in catechol pathway